MNHLIESLRNDSQVSVTMADGIRVNGFIEDLTIHRRIDEGDATFIIRTFGNQPYRPTRKLNKKVLVI